MDLIAQPAAHRSADEAGTVLPDDSDGAGSGQRDTQNVAEIGGVVGECTVHGIGGEDGNTRHPGSGVEYDAHPVLNGHLGVDVTLAAAFRGRLAGIGDQNGQDDQGEHTQYSVADDGGLEAVGAEGIVGELRKQEEGNEVHDNVGNTAEGLGKAEDGALLILAAHQTDQLGMSGEIEEQSKEGKAGPDDEGKAVRHIEYKQDVQHTDDTY